MVPQRGLRRCGSRAAIEPVRNAMAAAMPSSKPKPPAARKAASSRSADPGGGALGRARQFAVSRGLPPPQPEDEKPAPAKKKMKRAAKEPGR
jgi:hypothetical protein